MIRAAAGDREAFCEVYTLTSAKLFGICVRVCGDRAVAQDVLHDVYLIIAKTAGMWDPSRSSPITWLATIARNRSIDWRRAQGVCVMVPIDNFHSIIDPAPIPEVEAGLNRQHRSLHACLDRLEPRQATAIRKAFFGGLSYSELAQQEGVPLSTMKTLIRRGLRQLELRLDA